MRTSSLVVSLAILLSLLGTGSALAQAPSPRYVVTDLGDLGGGESLALDINSSGSIVGVSYLAGHTLDNPCDETRGFLYENGVMTELPSLPDTRNAIPAGISDSGDVAGSNDVLVPDPSGTGCFPGYRKVQTPVLVSDGVPRDISGPSPWYAGRANDVNSLGQVVGWSRKADLPNPRTWHAWLWESDVLTDLGTLEADWSMASSINEQGLVVGYSQLREGSGLYYGFRWSGGTMTQLPSLDTNTNNGANDVNESGDAIGWSGPSLYAAEPVLYPASGGVLGLGDLGGTWGSAYALNEQGIVVGVADTVGNSSRHAFVYRDGQMSDLNGLIPADAGWELIAATGINDVGEIVGYGCREGAVVWPGSCVDTNGSPTFRRAFVLTPVVNLSDLRDLVRSFDLRWGLETSLLIKLYAAQYAAEAGRIRTACNILQAFARQVEAQAGNGLTADQAEQLLQTLRLVRADLGCD